MLEFARTLLRQPERPKSKEILEEEKYRASGLVLRMKEAQDVVNPLIPLSTSNELPPINANHLNVAESCWLLKGPPSPAANQLQLPGGRRRPKQGNDKEDSIVAFVRELGEEIHIYGSTPVRCVTEWAHSFEHDNYPEEGSLKRNKKKRKKRINYHDTVLISEAPTTTDPQSYVSGDSIKEVVRLNLEQLHSLFANNFLFIGDDQRKKVYLQDSLSSNQEIRRKQNTRTDGQEDKIKPELTRAALAFEVKTLIKVTMKFFEITFSSDRPPEYLQRRLTRLLSGLNIDYLNALNELDEVSLNSLRTELIALLNTTEKNSLGTADIDLSQTSDVFPPALTVSLTASTDHIDRQRQIQLKKRAKFIRNFRRAQKLVTIENNLVSFEKAGPQAPFLFGQSFLLLDRHTQYEYQLLTRCKEMQYLLGTLCEVFGVRTDQSADWHDELKRKMTNYRRQKIRYNLSPETLDENIESYVTSVSRQLTKKFAEKLNITAGQLAEHLKNALDYSQHYLPQTLASSPALQTHLQAQLVPVRTGKSSIDFDELCLSFMGIPSSDTGNTSQETQWVALRTILLAMTDIHAKRLSLKNKTTSVFDPFLTYFNLLKQETIRTEQGKEGDEKIYERVSLKVRSQMVYPWGDVTKVEFGRVVPQILSFFREKDDKSIARKLIERGEEDGESILDYYGRMIVLDTEDFWNQLVKTAPFLSGVNPQDKAKLTKVWACDVVKHILEHYENQAESSGYAVKKLNPRLYGMFEDLFPHEHYPGSGASKITWDWAKFVLEFTSGNLIFREELQFFTASGAAERLADRRRYEYERLFISHKYFPSATVYFLPHPQYGELIRQGKQTVVVFKRKPNGLKPPENGQIHFIN